jgi:hypothetical protein
MKPMIVSPYKGPEKNCGDRLKVLLLQAYDMSDRHNLQVYEILSVMKTLVLRQENELSGTERKNPKKAPPANSSCGDDYKTKTKYKGPEKTPAASLSVCQSQIKDMLLIDWLDSETIYNLIKELVEEHIIEIDELEEEKIEHDGSNWKVVKKN